MSVFLMVSAALGSTASSRATDDVSRARVFLQALATNGSEAKKLATGDALVVVGDIGAKLADAFQGSENPFADLALCHVGTLLQKSDPSKSLQQLVARETGNPHNGKLSVVEGTYVCPSKDVPGTERTNKVALVFEDSRVVMFSLVGQH